MPGRRIRVPNIYNVHIPVDLAAHSEVAHSLLVALIKHLSYAREQCHAPCTQLEVHAKACKQQQQQQLEQKGRRKRLPPAARKAVKYFDGLTGLLQLAENIPHHQLQGMAVAVMLGSSVQRPREVYCIHFPAAMHTPGSAQAPPTSAVAAATRKLLRALVMQHETITEWDEPPGPTKLWLLFQAPDGELQSAPQGFTIRRAFNINLRKAFQVNLLLGGPALTVSTPAPQQHKQHHQQHHQQQQQHCQQTHLPQSAAAVAAPGAGADVDMVDDLSQQLSVQMSIQDCGEHTAGCSTKQPPVWFQCSIHVKGLKPSSSH